MGKATVGFRFSIRQFRIRFSPHCSLVLPTVEKNAPATTTCQQSTAPTPEARSRHRCGAGWAALLSGTAAATSASRSAQTDTENHQNRASKLSRVHNHHHSLFTIVLSTKFLTVVLCRSRCRTALSQLECSGECMLLPELLSMGQRGKLTVGF